MSDFKQVHSKTVLGVIPEGSLPEGKSPGWEVKLNGVVVPKVESLMVENPAFGIWTYGRHPQGSYDIWAFHENGGGGSVIVPYVVYGGTLHVGLIRQKRENTGGEVLNVPRGFVEPGETHFAAAQREGAEEMDVEVTSRSLFALVGSPMNPNSTFFETWGEGEGCRFYGLRFLEADMVQGSEGLMLDSKRLAPVKANADDKVKQKEQKLMEQIVRGVRFLPWLTALQSSDMFTVAGTGRLVGTLKQSL